MPANPSKTTSRFRPWWILLLLIAVIAAARYHTYNEPIERDLGIYAVFGHEMLQGRPLYTDLFDNKPPLIYLTYAFSELIVGYGQQQFFFLGLLAAILTLLGIYRLGVAGAGVRGGIWAAVFWTLICSDMLLEANQPNVEVFLNLAVVWALVFLIPYPAPARNILLAGVMLAVSSLYKIVGIQFVLLFPLVFFLFEPKGRRILNTLRSAALLAVPIVVGWGITALYFKLNGRWEDFYNGIYVLNHSYAGNQWQNLMLGLSPKNLFHPALLFLIPVLLLIVPACIKNLRKNPKIWFLFAAYAVGTYFSVARAGKFFPHYYQFWLPLAAVGGGWAIVVLGDWLKPLPWGKWLCWAPAVFALGFILVHEVPNYALNADEWSQRKYGNDFLDGRNTALRISELLKPGEDFFHFSRDPNLYFYAGKKPPTGMLWIDHAQCGPLAETLLNQYKRDLATHPAELMVLDQRAFSDHYKNILDGFVYWESFPENGHYSFWVKKGGKLETRLKENGSFPTDFWEKQ